MLLYLILFVSVHVEVSPQNFDDDIPLQDEGINVPRPVPFGHIFRSGIDDPDSGYIAPIDLLELSMRWPNTREEQERALRTYPKSRYIKFDKTAPFGPSNRDLYEDDLLNEKDKNATVHNEPLNFKFEEINQKNLHRITPKHPPLETVRQLNKQMPKNTDESFGKAFFFARDSFDVPRFNNEFLNWTTCEDFEKDIGAKNVVYPKDIVDIDWEPFYIWAERKHMVAIVHRFSYPTKKLVQEYRDNYAKFIPKFVDWEQPKLVLKERNEMLLIAGDRKGLFYAIPHYKIPMSVRHKNITYPVLEMRLKIADPYLAIMFCNEMYATLLASPENLPQTKKEKIEESKHLHFVGHGYPVSRNLFLEKLKVIKEQEQKQKEEARKTIVALPGYPGIDDIMK